MDWCVRRLDPREWELLRTMRLGALRDAPYAFGATYDDELARTDDGWRSFATLGVWFCHEVDGQPFGLVAGGRLPADTADERRVFSMWVSPRYRGSGMAGELLDAVAGWARAEGARTLALHVADGNVAARRFYERHGFTDTGSGEPLRSDPAVTTREMRRPL